jgi:glycosyltransferase involved in cell wall biosynthesis
VRRADLVLTTSQSLRELVAAGYGARGEVIAMPSTVDTAVFHPRTRDACRDALGLPRDALLVGTAGGLYRDKGIEALYTAWARLREEMPRLHLVLAGPHEAGLPPPRDDRVHYLGALPHAQVAELFCALDVGAICILDTAFGRYCCPQKAYEMLACGLPVVAADVGAMGALFAETPQCLYAAGDAADLAAKLHRQATQPIRPDIAIEDWQQIMSGLEARLSRLAAR